MAAITAKTDFSGFRDACQQIQKRLGVSMRTVIRSEIGSIFKQVAGDVKVTTEEKTDMRSRNKVTRRLGYTGGQGSKAAQPITVNSGRQGPTGRVFILKKDGSGFRRTHNAGFDPLWRHYSDVQWRDIQEAVNTVIPDWGLAIPAGRKTMGLARQSVIQQTDAIGIDLAKVRGGGISALAVRKARAAVSFSGAAYTNGTAIERTTSSKYEAVLTDTLPYARKIGIDKAIARRINGRTAFFKKNVEKGVFDDVRTILRAYKGMGVQ